tara:strand:+ start:27948 stop:28094 length:147 start_codon:yes stop_codon:yes gene_type:complete
MKLNELLVLALEVRDYVEQKGKTLPISQGKMLKDNAMDVFIKEVKYTA